jgi:hypothetical protein
MTTPLQPQRETRFLDVATGSKVRYSHNLNLLPPFEATVLEVKDNWGQHAIPAHIFRRENSLDAELMPADGTWRVEVLVDSKIMAPAAESPNVLHGARRPSDITAIQFRGGIDSAQEVIQFGAGKVNSSWNRGDAQNVEAIVISKATGDELIVAGNYLVIEGGVPTVYSPEAFGNIFDIDGGQTFDGLT